MRVLLLPLYPTAYAFFLQQPAPFLIHSRDLTPLSAAATTVIDNPAPIDDLSGRIPDCPATVWNYDDIDYDKDIKGMKLAPQCPVEWRAPKGNEEASYFAYQRDAILAQLREHGCVWFRGFELMKNEDGFRAMYNALGLDPCLDPIHTSGLRAFASQRDAIYEEVNKQSLREHYIGLHQESTHKKTAKYGAFVCFQPATIRGGEFLIADAAKILRDLDPAVAKKFMDRKIRISVSNLDLNFLDVTGPLKAPLMDGAKTLIDKLVAPKFDMDLEMIYGSDGKPMRLQAVERTASPVNRHPDTGLPLWFCNIHNHARYLRDRRPCKVPEVGMTEVYFGDLSPIPAEDLVHINEVSEKHIAHIPMQAGDVLLCDNYRVLHGRDIFEGDRYHAVSWFGGLVEDRRQDEDTSNSKPGNLLNKAINKLLVDTF